MTDLPARPTPRSAAFVLLLALAGPAVAQAPARPLPPLDPQQVQDQDAMTWNDYRPIPGIDWADPALKPKRDFRVAVVAVDFPDQPFVITRPKFSDPFGNPQLDPVARAQVPQFYADFFGRPNAVNHGQTIHRYWMEQSRGRFGITTVDAYGPYRMPQPLWAYGLNEYGQNESTPDGSRASARMEPHVDSLWAADKGDIKKNYDAILRIYATYDETGVWQEFGEMKFNTKEDIPPEWGNPNPAKPRWIPTRYVPWTSWLAGSQQWGLSSMRQGENSGTITHEIGHFAFRIPDLNNNPYREPYRRVATGTWDMMDRGSFNGPGGPHMRWVVPPTQGAAMPAGLMVRNRLAVGFVDTAQVLRVNREALAKTGIAVAEVTARAVEPLPGTYAGIVVRLDGPEPQDRTPTDTSGTNPLSPGIANYNFYSLEVVQRLGYDSFTPDNGVLLAKNKDSSRGNNGGPNGFNSFIWVIDAHPEDMNVVDFVRPNGQKVLRTVADYRQLNDALFHAGLNSGSEFEWIDELNRLHFYVLDLRTDERGIRVYKLGVKSLDGAGPATRGVTLNARAGQPATVARANTPVWFELRNTGTTAQTDPALHPQDARRHLNADIYRLRISVAGNGWTALLQNALATAEPGQTVPVSAFVTASEGAAATALVTIVATSESDPSRIATAQFSVRR
ncbi:MAG: peptidase M6 [Chloroflexi bacterium]|nr:peptidase M6 [Chloroflexota bacterium]